MGRRSVGTKSRLTLLSQEVRIEAFNKASCDQGIEVYCRRTEQTKYTQSSAAHLVIVYVLRVGDAGSVELRRGSFASSHANIVEQSGNDMGDIVLERLEDRRIGAEQVVGAHIIADSTEASVRTSRSPYCQSQEDMPI
jgi:hypothetical protein